MNKTTGRKRVIGGNTADEGVFTPDAYEEVIEERTATLLTKQEYAKIKSNLLGTWRHEIGEKLIFEGPYDDPPIKMDKIVLLQDEWIKLIDKETGDARVVTGPKTLVPKVTEVSTNGTQKAVFLEADSAVLVLDKADGSR